MRALAPSSRRCLHGTKGGSCCLALERASWLPWPLVSPFQASSFCKHPKDSPHHSEGMPGARSVGRITACGYPPALQGIGGYRLWRYSPYGTFERASCLLLKLFSVPALASCFAFPGEFLLQASKRNQKTRPGIRPQPLLGWGALAASLLPAARRHGPSWTEAALAASCHSSPSATIPLGLLTGRVCRPTTWRASLTSWMPGTRSVGRIPPMAAFALRDYTAMNGAGWPFCSFLSFLAAYTAVNKHRLVDLARPIFLAAYTAVNE